MTKSDTGAAPSGLSRRNALKLAAVAGGASAGALFSGVSFAQEAAPAAATDASTGMPNWRRIALGEASVTIILDGLRPGEGPHPTFGENQSAEAVAELMRTNFLPETRIVTSFLPVLVEMGENLVLFDTGFGPGGRENGQGRLVERMAQAGYAPGDVDIVVLTHMHGDHIGGLMEGDVAAFPNARYVAGQVEYDFWISEEAKNGPRAQNAAAVEKLVVPMKDKMTFVAEGDEIVPGIVAYEAFGHSPGHLVFEITSGERSLWLTADSANHFVASLQRPDWEVRFDMDKAAGIASRRKVFDRIAEARAPFIGYHMPFPGVGFVEKDGEGYRYVPLTYQLDV